MFAVEGFVISLGFITEKIGVTGILSERAQGIWDLHTLKGT